MVSVGNRQWQAATGGAAAAAALYLTGGAAAESQGAVIHITTPISITSNGTGTQPDVNWDVDGNGSADFRLHSSSFIGYGLLSINGGGAFVNKVGAGEDGIEGFAPQASQF